MNGSGYVVPQVGCSVCGAACDPLAERCPRCRQDPFAAVGMRLGPLSWTQFWRGFGWRLMLFGPLVGWLAWRKQGTLLAPLALPWWAQLALGILVLIALITFGHQLWLNWQAAHVALVLTPSEAWLFQRRGGRTYFERMPWQEATLPELPRGWHVLELIGALVHFISHAGLQVLAVFIPDHAYELRLRSRYDAGRRWRIALVGAQHHPRFSLTYIAAYALPHWLQSGLVRTEPGYEPSPERRFLALDLKTRMLRAYAFREVRLDEGRIQVDSDEGATPARNESFNPDGSRVESDHSLSPDSAQVEQAEREHLRRFELPAFAVRYGNYWLRADWDIIKRIESRRAASETAAAPLQSPKPA